MAVTSWADLRFLSGVTSVTGNVTLNPAAQIKQASLPSLTHIGGDLVIRGNAVIERLALPGLTTVGGGLDIANNLRLETPLMTALVSLGGALVVTNNAEICPDWAVALDTELGDPGSTIYGNACMSLIPGGTFLMGDSLDGMADAPTHTVTLSTFEIDIFEVTTNQYEACMTAGGCTEPGNRSIGATPYYGESAYAYHPVVNVDWGQANAYCAWAGKHLPTEAQWEYAARGGLVGKRFARGDTLDCTQAAYYHRYNYYPYDVDPAPSKECGLDSNLPNAVGTFPANGYGLYDMDGNAFEWVADWYGIDYSATATDPTGPADGDTLILRGGDYADEADYARVAFRYAKYAMGDLQDNYSGFRCAR